LNGVYTLATDLAYADLSCYYDYMGDALNFVVTDGGDSKGVANLDAQVSFTRLTEHTAEIGRLNGKLQVQDA
jgi:hypothetical protein